ncbi:hypothetical protein HID58_042128 [Brassica napus]|uniref:Ubiquitin-like protease family profile domain-containing protein n=1 Tax=Brassica napus TaxID=3708 RepID=A0ABQ8BCU5_BRANA|nr:hypothetical protein HID58_042128 [Brassica napus]
MEIELPKRIAEAGAEHHVDKINNTCRLTVMRLVKQDLEDEYNDVLRDPLDRKVDVAVEESQVQIDEKDEIAVEGELAVSENEEPVESVAKRRVTRKAKDPGCESRKRQLLCQRAAEQNTGLDDQTKNFMTGLFNTSFNSMKEEVKKHMDHRFDMLDSEIAQLKQTVAAAIVSRNDVPASERPQPSAMPSPHPKRKDENLDDVEMHDFHGNLHNVSVSQSSNIDLEMGTQDYLWKTMGNLTQDSYVKGFDPSQKAKVDDPMEWLTPLTSLKPKKNSLPFLRDINFPEDRVKDKDYSLVFVPEESWAKLVEWSLTSMEIQIVTFNVYKRDVSTYSWTYRVVKELYSQYDIAKKIRKKEDHLFKCVDEAMVDELRRIEAQQAIIEEEIEDWKKCLKKADERVDVGCIGIIQWLFERLY